MVLSDAINTTLLRVAFLLPAIAGIAWWVSKSGGPVSDARPAPPIFLFGFLALAALNSMGVVPPAVQAAATQVSSFLIITAIAALGMKTSLLALARIGMGPVLLLLAETVFIGLLVIFHSVAGWLFGYTIKPFPSPFPADAWYGGSLMSAHEVGAIVVALGMVALLFMFLRYTPLGLAMRAAAQNAATSREYQRPAAGLLSRRKPPSGSVRRSRPVTVTGPSGQPRAARAQSPARRTSWPGCGACGSSR